MRSYYLESESYLTPSFSQLIPAHSSYQDSFTELHSPAWQELSYVGLLSLQPHLLWLMIIRVPSTGWKPHEGGDSKTHTQHSA